MMELISTTVIVCAILSIAIAVFIVDLFRKYSDVAIVWFLDASDNRLFKFFVIVLLAVFIFVCWYGLYLLLF